MHPLTQSQLLLWMGQQLNPKAPLYNMAFLFELKGSLDVAAFQQAFAQLLRECTPLRTAFRIQDGEPRQEFCQDFDYELVLEDWSATSPSYAAVESWAQQRSQHNFDLEQRAFESILIRAHADRYYWYLNQHHLITDAWAVTVMYDFVMATYTQLRTHGQLAVAGLPPYTDYLAFEQEARLRAQRTNPWAQKLADLPLARPRLYGFKGLQTGTRAGRYRLPLSAEHHAALQALGQEPAIRSWTPHATNFNIFLTTLFAYLYRVSGQSHLAVGAPAHNRVKPAFKRTPGVFIELFPLSVQLEPTDTFLTLYRKVRDEVNGSFLLHAQPGASTADLSRSFAAVLNYIHADFTETQDLAVRSQWIHPGHCDPHHHLRVQVYDFDRTGALELYFDLNEDVFAGDLPARALEHFRRLLEAFLDDRQQLIAAVPLATTEEKTQVNTALLRPPVPAAFADHIVSAFERQVQASPTALALRMAHRQLSYDSLNAQANQLAHSLLAQGLGKGDRVGIHLGRSPELLLAIWAVLKTGAAYVPLPTDLPQERLRELVEQAQTKVLLSTQSWRDYHQGLSPFYLDQEDWQQAPTHNPAKRIAAEDLAYLMFTSGSTGTPKGVMITHGALAHYLNYAVCTYTDGQPRAFALFTRIGFDLTVTSLFTPLLSGGHIVIYPEPAQGPDLAVFAVMEDNQVDVIKLTPAHLELLRGRSWQHSQLKCMIVGGEAFKTDLARAVQQAFPTGLRIFNEYGPTEATVGCIVYELGQQTDAAATVPIGLPIPGTEAYLLDPYGNQVPVGLVGEIYLGGPNLAVGYWQAEAQTQAHFVPHPWREGAALYRTGDLAIYEADRGLSFLERRDQQLKIGGIRVEAAEIERAIVAHTDIQAVGVVLRERANEVAAEDITYCVRCGLPSTYPGVKQDSQGVCDHCRTYERYAAKVKAYFKTLDDLREIFRQAQARKQGEFDALVLLSGGKDSTYALAQLVEMGYRVLAFTLDNGYISQQALDNVERVAKELGVPCVVGSTSAMNEIFVDSLQRYHNVCNGCFKTIYTLATQVAYERGIPLIVTGLSRGQFFETRLTEELFLSEHFSVDDIDRIILEARKEYHRVDDAPQRLLDTSVFQDEQIFEQIHYVDFYRYTDVSLAD
ncbi:MAG: amino acid adenylation domain-containing protein, partial [Bacteroidetes bacterium]